MPRLADQRAPREPWGALVHFRTPPAQRELALTFRKQISLSLEGRRSFESPFKEAVVWVQGKTGEAFGRKGAGGSIGGGPSAEA